MELFAKYFVFATKKAQMVAHSRQSCRLVTEKRPSEQHVPETQAFAISRSAGRTGRRRGARGTDAASCSRCPAAP